MLHQANRERDGEGRIIATLQDYEVVQGLVADLIGEGVEQTVSKATRETYEAVLSLEAASGVGTTYAALAKQLNLDRSTAKRRADVAIELGYLSNAEERGGRPARLEIAEPMPEDNEILPSVERLRGCTVA